MRVLLCSRESKNKFIEWTRHKKWNRWVSSFSNKLPSWRPTPASSNLACRGWMADHCD